MAAFFLLLTVLVGVVLGDALVENDGAGVLTLFGQTTGRFNQGQLLLVFAGLGFLFASLLVLSLTSTRRRRTRRKERRAGTRELGERITELERDNARLQDDLSKRDDALAGREAELAHRDRQLALKDEELAWRDHELVDPQEELARREEDLARRERELARREEDLHGAGTHGAAAPPVGTPAATAVLDQPTTAATEVPTQAAEARTGSRDPAAAPATEVLDRGAVAPLHDEPPWLAGGAADREGGDRRPVRSEVEHGQEDEPTQATRADADADRALDDGPGRRTEKPDQNS
jgi:hypothetical protein